METLPLCSTKKCSRAAAPGRTGKCGRCYRYEWLQRRPTCIIGGCKSPSPHASGYCGLHHHRFRRYGDPLAGPGRGVPGKPRGIRRMEGRYIANGYVRIRVFDENGRARWVLEHRHVMEQILGRPLYPDEQVHHKHEPKTDNSPGNLEL